MGMQMPMAQDPFAAARVAILGNLLAQQRAAPVLALQVDLQRVSAAEDEHDDMHLHGHHHDHDHDEDDDEDDDDDDDESQGACLMGLALLMALVFTSAFLCTRAMRMLVARSARARLMTAQPAILVDSSAEDLAAPLLVVQECHPSKA